MIKILSYMVVILSFSNALSQESIYDISINDINGNAINLEKFKGKNILFVNVASECSFTPQYKGLEELHQQFKNNLVIIGVPCNQFGFQEPGSPEEIQTFCTLNYNISFD